MALVLANRVQETTTTTGTGTITLAGAVSGFQSFAVIGNTNTTYYTITSGTAWEVGIGTYTLSGTTLARTTILSSSIGGGAITLAGTSNVFATYPAEKSVNLDASGNATALGTPASGTVTNLTGTASININGTVGATTATTGAFTTISGSTSLTAPTINGGTAAASTLTLQSTSGAGTTDAVIFKTASQTERMRITTGGNVGIGTASPSQTLDVVGIVLAREDTAAGATPVLLRNSNIGNNTTKSSSALFQGTDTVGTVKNIGSIGFFPDDANYISANLRFLVRSGDAAPTEKMRLTNGGNLGIGTASPGGLLDVTGTSGSVQVSTGGDQISYTYNGFNYLTATGAAATLQIQASGASGTLVFATNAAERMRIDSSGNVGIGTSAPAAKLDVIGTIYSRPGNAAGAVAELTADASSGANGISLIAGFTSGGYGPIKLLTSATERMRITTGGNVGIGTASPSQTLDVNGAIGVATSIYTGSGANNANSVEIGSGRTGSNYAYIDLIGDTTYSDYGLRILRGDGGPNTFSEMYHRGTGFFYMGTIDAAPVVFVTSSTERMRIGATGAITAAGVYNNAVGATNRDVFVDDTGLVGYVSSIRASKTNICSLDDVGWIDALRPVKFNYRKRDAENAFTDDSEAPLEYGLIAEEVEAVNPELVFYDSVDDDLELRGVSYSKLVIPLLQRVQELTERVRSLEAAAVAQSEGN